MATKIRLCRIGAKKKPFYRFVVAHSQSSRDGKFIEAVGTYDPLEKPAKISLKEDRVYYWLNEGAVPSDTANALLRQIGLLKKWRMMKKKKDTSGMALAATIIERKKKRKKKSEAAPKKQKEAKPAKGEEKQVEEKQEGEKKSE